VSRFGACALPLALTVAMGWLMAQTLALGPAARLVPQVTIGGALALLVVLSLRELGRAWRGRTVEPPAAVSGLRELRALAWIAATIGLIALLGAAMGTALVLAGYLRLEARAGRLASLACGAALALAVEQGMRRALGVTLPPALLGW
jgi:hypothetical protein